MATPAPITLSEVTPALQTVWSDGPLIAVVASLNFPDLTEQVRELVIRYTSTALTTLIEMGARVVVIDPTDTEPVRPEDDIRGLVLLGGGDVDPALYGHHDEVPNLYGVDRNCDDYTINLIQQARSNNVPILGICRGAQIINVAYGGDLIPDLGPCTRHRGHGDGPPCVEDVVNIEPGTRLADLIGAGAAIVRSGHHQAVRAVAPQFRVAARGIDGIIEAIEHHDPATWILGVQWHPEDSDAPEDARRALFSALVARVRAQGCYTA